MRLSDQSELFLADQVAVVVPLGRRSEYSQTGLARLVRVFPTNIFLRLDILSSLTHSSGFAGQFPEFFLLNGKLKRILYVYFFCSHDYTSTIICQSPEAPYISLKIEHM